MEIFFSVGEPSGDQHAAHLILEIQRRRPDIRCTGFGGPEMENAGCSLLFRLTSLAVMFIWDTVPQLLKFYKLVKQAERYFRETPPDAVVLVDFPGFNWWIARKAKAAGIPVFYYLPPQLWAWGTWRIKKMRKFVDHILCGLAFEPKFYAQQGMQAKYVGHPFFDEIAAHQLDEQFLKQQTEQPEKIVGLLPGSRNKEIERNWGMMLKVARQLHIENPQVRFLVASYNDEQRTRCEELLREFVETVPNDAETKRWLNSIQFYVGKTSEIIEAAHCCLMVSGSVSLELLTRTTPATVIYKINTAARFFKWLFLKVPYITLPNLMAESPILPEWVVCNQPERDLREMKETLSRWLNDEENYRARIQELTTLRDDVVKTGATELTADEILRHLPEQTARVAA
ncbi:MAG: lipid-A-disaccharide synthase [Planctomycetaceae bacterium]